MEKNKLYSKCQNQFVVVAKATEQFFSGDFPLPSYEHVQCWVAIIGETITAFFIFVITKTNKLCDCDSERDVCSGFFISILAYSVSLCDKYRSRNAWIFAILGLISKVRRSRIEIRQCQVNTTTKDTWLYFYSKKWLRQ